MLAGIMRGLQFDSRALGNVDFWIEECIPPRDRLATHFHQSKRVIHLKTTIQQKNILAKDIEIQNLYEKAQELQCSIIFGAEVVKRTLDSSKNPEKAQKHLRKCDQQLQDINTRLKTLIPQGSGLISLTGLQGPEELYDQRLLDAKTPTNLVLNNSPPPLASNLHTGQQMVVPGYYGPMYPPSYNVSSPPSSYFGFGDITQNSNITPAIMFNSAWHPAPIQTYYSHPQADNQYFYHPGTY
ncbi:hypothetical protein Clacol_005830 [Clathrus columnatus]|uniref:Uncharacterized protein n=1 Tax=Clathrus columnatus TaxID=1419009 RepID=A0AAV5AB76_9AGAM|nr:hypothetical protein Clacol_005830 [Clathrus columnatus]